MTIDLDRAFTRLAETLPGYTRRQEQMDVCAVIDRAMGNDGKTPCIALTEAGTGVGKSLAYLVPAVRAIQRGKRVVVSTDTLGLQAQLANKDVPLLQQAFPEANIRPIVMKGRNNYACLQDYDLAHGDMFVTMEERWEDVRTWVYKTKTGDVADLPFVFPKWSDIAAKQETCKGPGCYVYDRCFYYKMRTLARSANLVIVNHSLFMADLIIRKESPEAAIIPDYDIVVMDEAHRIETAATEAFSIRFESLRIPMMVKRLKKLKDIKVPMSLLSPLEDMNRRLFEPFRRLAERGKTDMFFSEAVNEREERYLLEDAKEMVSLLSELGEFLRGATDSLDATQSGAVGGMADTCGRIVEDMKTLFLEPEKGCIRWAQTSGFTATPSVVTDDEGDTLEVLGNKRKEGKIALMHSPVEIGGRLKTYLWSAIPSGILCSATLSNSGGFSYLRSRLALPEAEEIVVGSPFDFKTQAMLYVPAELPEPPKGYDEEYVYTVVEKIEEILRLSDGRAFLLFTSRRMMESVYEKLAKRIRKYPLFKQGDAPPGQLIEQFRASDKGVLFGLSTFWEGVDVQGEALSCVVIDRIPFAAPDSPLTRARTDSIKQRGGDWFREYAAPQAQLRLKQGFGRLIRTQDDKGIVTILDTRLITKPYGKEFVKYLPPATRGTQWSAVQDFWKQQVTMGF